MPSVLAGAIAAAFPATAATAFTLAGTAVTFATAIASGAFLIGGLALSATQAKRNREKQRDGFNAAQVDRLVSITNAMAPRELVLGRVRKGGAVYFRGAAGTNKTICIAHLALAAHEIDGIEAVYFNDTRISYDENGYVTSYPWAQSRLITEWGESPPADAIPSTIFEVYDANGNPTGRYSWMRSVTTYYARLWWDLGGGTAVADSRTRQLFPSLWTVNHRGQGIAKLIVEFTYNETAFPSGVPNVTAQIRGAKVYDPRNGTTAFSQNPALLMRHVYQHAYFGKATVSAAEDERFETAANACDVNQDYVSGGSTTTADIYRAALVAQYGTPAKNLLDDLAQAMAGMWAFAGGELYVHAGVYSAPVMTLTDDDLAVIQRSGESEEQEPVSIVVHRERAQKFNTVNARIWDASQGYKMVGLTPLKGTALIARDGEELAQEVAMPAVFFAPQALHIAGVMMRDARDPLMFEAPFKMTAYPLELFDSVAITLARYGWVEKVFQIRGRRWDRAKGIVYLTLKETAAAIYTPDTAFDPQGYAENTSTPSPWEVEPPAITESGIFSGTDELTVLADGTVVENVRVTWTAITDSSITQSGQIEVQWVPNGSEVWRSLPPVKGDETEVTFSGPAGGQRILIRARSRNSIAVSDWSYQVEHLVVGKTEPPDDVGSFTIDGDTLRWAGVDDVDLAGYEIRFAYGSQGFWDAAVPLHEGVLTSSPYTMATRPSGTVTFLIKAKDTSGNYSNEPAVIVTDLGDPEVSNVFLSYAEAPDFTGTITNGAVSGGVLQADALDSFYGSANQRFYGAASDAFYETGTYAALTYEWSATPTVGGRIVLQHAIAGDYAIQYRRGNQDAFYGADGDSFYGDSADPFFGEPGDWQTWPGALELAAPETLDFKVSVDAGATRGEVSTLTVVLDVPDVVQDADDLVISPSGTRITLTETFRVITNVQITVQDDGNGGRTAVYSDKDNLTDGPLVAVYNAAGAAVTGLVDVQIKGY